MQILSSLITLIILSVILFNLILNIRYKLLLIKKISCCSSPSRAIKNNISCNEIEKKIKELLPNGLSNINE